MTYEFRSPVLNNFEIPKLRSYEEKSFVTFGKHGNDKERHEQ